MPDSDAAVVFGRAVRRQRFELGITQEELAHRATLHRTYISDIELGLRNVSLKNIAKLAVALDLSVPSLFARTDGPTDPDRAVEILLIEDNPHDVELTLRAFWKAKITNVVNVARDGAEALDYLSLGEKTEKPRLPGMVLLDLHLPKIDGFEVLRRIKANKRTQKIPVVVLTVSDDEEDIAECRRLGIKSYIVKPVGFRNFSDITPNFDLRWTLQRSIQVEAG
jgi:two-component system, response regulator